ncbi:MAG: hypothetical protein H8E90_01975 [Anaerolineales bacterium]|nr:hypothetical protein [Anaerolineales bacterium]
MARPGPLAAPKSQAMWEEAGKKDTRVRAIAWVEKLLQKTQVTWGCRRK